MCILKAKNEKWKLSILLCAASHFFIILSLHAATFSPAVGKDGHRYFKHWDPQCSPQFLSSEESSMESLQFFPVVTEAVLLLVLLPRKVQFSQRQPTTNCLILQSTTQIGRDAGQHENWERQAWTVFGFSKCLQPLTSLFSYMTFCKLLLMSGLF